jgi:hypothetical protein
VTKNKQMKKKKDRERRVAQKKLATQKRAQENKTKQDQTAAPKPKKLTDVSLPKTSNVSTSKKSPFTQRRGVS